MTGGCRIDFLGCPLDLVDHQDILTLAAEALGGGQRLRIEGLNVAKLVDARADPALMAALNEAELVHVDGAGINLGLALGGHRRPVRRPGIDLMVDLCRLAAEAGRGIYLLGARPGVAETVARRLQASVPGLSVTGVGDGYFSDDQAPVVVEAIRGSGAGVLFIGISSPRKELFLSRYWDNLGVDLAMGVGGSFDVLAGRLRRAPPWMQRMGLEWLFRLLQEPGRLTGRYARTNLAYLALLAGLRTRTGIRKR